MENLTHEQKELNKYFKEILKKDTKIENFKYLYFLEEERETLFDWLGKMIEINEKKIENINGNEARILRLEISIIKKFMNSYIKLINTYK